MEQEQEQDVVRDDARPRANLEANHPPPNDEPAPREEPDIRRIVYLFKKRITYVFYCFSLVVAYLITLQFGDRKFHADFKISTSLLTICAVIGFVLYRIYENANETRINPADSIPINFLTRLFYATFFVGSGVVIFAQLFPVDVGFYLAFSILMVGMVYLILDISFTFGFFHTQDPNPYPPRQGEMQIPRFVEVYNKRMLYMLGVYLTLLGVYRIHINSIQQHQITQDYVTLLISIALFLCSVLFTVVYTPIVHAANENPAEREWCGIRLVNKLLWAHYISAIFSVIFGLLNQYMAGETVYLVAFSIIYCLVLCISALL